jgi:hypothetical protein
MTPTTTPVTARHPDTAPHVAGIASPPQRRADAVTWLGGQLEWERLLDDLRNTSEIRGPDVPPPAAAPRAIESPISADRAVLAPSDAGRALADPSAPAVPRHSRQNLWSSSRPRRTRRRRADAGLDAPIPAVGQQH